MMKRYNWLCGILFFGCLVTHQVHADKNDSTELHKVYHHRNVDPDSAHADVELGKVFFHFSKTPIMNAVPHQKETQQQELVFFFPLLKIASGAQPMIEKLNDQSLPWYSVQLEAVKVPIKGVKCTVRFDATKVGFSMDHCDSIVTQENGTREKCLEFRFLNKPLLEKMNKQMHPVTRLADASRVGVVIDCGHGGTDKGAVGFFNLTEKDLTMKVGLHVAQLLKNQGIEVFLTRDMDKTVHLDQRTFFVNTCNKARLLVSIHANFSKRAEASGIETFCLDGMLFKPGFSTLDNSLKNIVSSVSQDRYEKSSLLAQSLQGEVLHCAKKKHLTVVDRKVKHSVSQMLVGSNIPSALIEIGFLSNKQEAQFLSDKEYQSLIAQGICDGILSYMKTA